MKATVEKELCSGCSVCVDVCPEVFDLDDNDQAIVKTDPVPADQEEACQEAADQCPSEAITIEA